MKKQRLVSILTLSVLLMGQLGWAGVGLADSPESTPSPSPEASVSPSPSPTPEASPTPSPEVSPTPSPSPQPSASPSPEPTPSTTPKPKHKSTDVGPDGCGGTIPDWVYDVATSKWVAADKASFSCDKTTGYYLSPKYYYDGRTGWYKIIPVGQPAPEGMLTAPSVVHTTLGDLTVGSQDYQMAQALGLLEGQNSIIVSSTGPGSTNQGQITNSGQNWVDLTNLVNVINTLQSAASSGNVAADSNTHAGDLSTGTVSVIANLFNLLASAWSWAHGNLNFFTQTLCQVNQTCTGDIVLNPTEGSQTGGGQLGGSASVSGTGADSTNGAAVTNTSDLNVNAQSQGNIVNNVDLTAQSGDATASRNTNVGNVATGNVFAEANIVNLISSFISSGSSFFGILNIFGTLNGDILFPDGFLNGLVPSSATPSSASVSGTGADSTNQAGVSNSGQTTINNTATTAVANNITTSATSGSVGAEANTTAGNLTTGVANTTQGLFNLANSSIFGDNAVLVIVNVLGHWVGKIMTVPGGGATGSALLTGNAQVSTTGADSNNASSVSNSTNTNINAQSVGTITNNVNVEAQSGDAVARQNTNVGNVSTGNAQATSSVANIVNSVLNVKHWFGVLVINVLGGWTGDLNHDSEAGNTPLAAHVIAAAVMPEVGLDPVAVSSMGASSGVSASAMAAPTPDVAASGGRVLTAAAEQPVSARAAAQAKGRDMSMLFGLSAVVMLLAGVMASVDRKLRRR